MSKSNLNSIITSGGIAYKAWQNTLSKFIKAVQEDVASYVLLTGQQLPDDLNPVNDMVALWKANEDTLDKAVVLVDKAMSINDLIDEFDVPTTPPGPLPPSNDPFVHPGGNIVVPNGANPFKYLIDKAEANYPNPQKGDMIPIYLPVGAYKGVEIGGKGSTPLDRVNPWWGDATLVIMGHPQGTMVTPVHNNDGWGSTMVIAPEVSSGGSWGGYVQCYDLMMEASGGNVLQLGRYGSQSKVPLKGLLFKRCKFLDHPLASVTTTRPISANQCAMSFIECLWHLPLSQEHAVYSRNPYGNSLMDNCTVTAVGAQIWQEVGRPDEGVFFGYPGGKTTIKNSHFCCYHKDPGRAGSAITIAGSARDWDILNNVVQDLDESDDVYGAFVSWDGGKHYAIDGQDMTGKSESQKKGNYANGRIVIKGNTFVQKNPNRNIFGLDSCLYAEVTENGIYGNKAVDISDDKDAGIGELIWRDNNRPEDRQRAIDAGIPTSLLIDPQMKVNGQIVGTVSKNIRMLNDKIV